MPKPIIGILTCKKELGNDSSLPMEAAAMNLSYIRSVEDGGGVPLLLPYTENTENLSALLKLCGGLLVPGGIDIAPSLYGEAPDQNLGEVDPVLDKEEFFALRYALSASMPVFGICRGLQIMNVFCGGTLYQDLPSQLGKELSAHRQTTAWSSVSHKVKIEKTSVLSSVMGCEKISVNSLHHQAIKVPGRALSVSARSEDGVIEAVEHENGLWFAVQWHPEELSSMPEMKRLFSYFIGLSSEYRAGKLI